MVKGYLAPAGTRVPISDLVRGFAITLTDPQAPQRLQSRLAQLTGTNACHLVSSGRAALTLVLNAMKRARGGPSRDEVIVPAYSCYSVAAAVHRAGLKLRLCDVDPATFAIDPSSLDRFDPDRTLAIIACSLFGVPDPLLEIERWSLERNVFMIDDAAQSLGASIQGRPVGGFGDAGILSFGKGKCITSMGGGAIVSRNQTLAPLIAEECDRAGPAGFTAAAKATLQFPLYMLLLRPRLYAIARHTPGLELGVTVYDPEFSIEGYPAVMAGVAWRLCERLTEINSQRRSNGMKLQSSLDGIAGVTARRIPEHADAIHLRYALLVDDPKRRDELLRSFDRAGIGATAAYPQALCDVPQIRAQLHSDDLVMAGASRVARSIVTLPTHAFVSSDLPRSVRELVTSWSNGGVRSSF